MRNLLLACILIPVAVGFGAGTGFGAGVVASPVRGQEPPAVVRLVMTREGGPVPVGETTAFEATGSKAVAWAQFATPVRTQGVVFRWFDPERRLRRASPFPILTRGEDFVWDDLLIKGHAPANLAGLWTVELRVDDRLLTTIRFSILPRKVAPPVTVRYQSLLVTTSQETRTGLGMDAPSTIHSFDHRNQFAARLREDRTPVTTSLAASRAWGGLDGDRASGNLSFTLGPRLLMEAGIEAQTVSLVEIPPRRIETRALFFGLQYTPPHWPSISLSFRQDGEVDARAPHVTDSVTTTWALFSSYARGSFSFSGSYTIQGVDDRTITNADFVNRTLTLTAAYSPSPRLSLFLTRTSLAQDFGATAFSPAFTQQTDTTSGRLTYQLTPNLSVALFTLETAAARSDAVFTFSTSQRGLEVAYRLNDRLSLKALTQWQEQTTLAWGVASKVEQRLSSYGIDVFLPQNLMMGIVYSPQVTTAGSSDTRADVLTAYANFSPRPRSFFTGTYTLTRTTGAGVETINTAWALSMRYTPNPWVEYQGMAQVNNALFPLFPAANTFTATYQITATWKF